MDEKDIGLIFGMGCLTFLLIGLVMGFFMRPLPPAEPVEWSGEWRCEKEVFDRLEEARCCPKDNYCVGSGYGDRMIDGICYKESFKCVSRVWVESRLFGGEAKK